MKAELLFAVPLFSAILNGVILGLIAAQLKDAVLYGLIKSGIAIVVYSLYLAFFTLPLYIVYLALIKLAYVLYRSEYYTSTENYRKKYSGNENVNKGEIQPDKGLPLRDKRKICFSKRRCCNYKNPK